MASRCPFAQAASFLLNPHGPAKPTPAAPARPQGPVSPLGAAGGAEFANTHLWLDAGMPGQDAPGRLVPGLRKLSNLDEFLIQLPEEMPHELGLKMKALEDPARRPSCVVAEPSSLEAQAECLEVFMEYLPRRYPNLYELAGEGEQRTIAVRPTGEVHRVSDYAHCPLELCARIAQEDLVLMREQRDDSGAVCAHVMAAAVVVFSFAGLAEKLSAPMNFIHAPVPRFQQELDKLLAKTFSGLLPNSPLWRNNWGLADNGQLDMPMYGSEEAAGSRVAEGMLPSQRWLKTEYQTLRRLPCSRYILFTVRTMVEPLSSLAQAPRAAAALAASLRGMPPAMRAYKGLIAEGAAEGVLAYLDELAAAAVAGGEPGGEAGGTAAPTLQPQAVQAAAAATPA